MLLYWFADFPQTKILTPHVEAPNGQTIIKLASSFVEYPLTIIENVESPGLIPAEGNMLVFVVLYQRLKNEERSIKAALSEKGG